MVLVEGFWCCVRSLEAVVVKLGEGGWGLGVSDVVLLLGFFGVMGFTA